MSEQQASRLFTALNFCSCAGTTGRSQSFLAKGRLSEAAFENDCSQNILSKGGCGAFGSPL